MTVSELATRLNATVSEVFEHYQKIFVKIPQEEDYVLTPDEIERAIPNYKNEEHFLDIELPRISNLKSIPTELEDLTSNYEERKKRSTVIPDDLEPYFKKGDAALLYELKKHNSIPDFILQGDFRKVPDNNFGFFQNITHQDGMTLTYPVLNDSVDEIFIPSGGLIHGQRYSFEATIAKRHVRVKKVNPFLLQARSENILEIIELNALNQEIDAKKVRIEELNTYLEETEAYYEEKKSEIEEKVLAVFHEKQNEAEDTIESYNIVINDKFNEIESNEKKLTSLREAVEETNKQLRKMENLLDTLKDRVSLCKNLHFISENDEKKYLSFLSAKEFIPINHLHFEKDFDKDFTKLSDHIHSYLFHKKNLIYTRYQIRNFLTLIKTHDLIILSGLSGSGKTQIVKAFAEALGGVAKIIPVKPNWTSSDDLIGYFNPLQMSFLPTPFSEAIVEAINNPSQLYLICLDEMNLARVEYYFADFLSKLEERNCQPEIELYANHEEELFVSEFNSLLNFIESSINGKGISSWKEFLDNEEARTKLFQMLGSTDKEPMLQLHAKMKRRLIDIMKFPSTIRIPSNVRFIGAINVDETTHYFSPKIIDRIHVVRFENPLLLEEQVSAWFEFNKNETELKPVYVNPGFLPSRSEYPSLKNEELSFVEEHLKNINKNYLIPLKIDFGIRSLRQSLNYYDILRNDESRVYIYWDHDGNECQTETTLARSEILQILNTVIIQKIFPRFIFDGNDITFNGKTKKEVVGEFLEYLERIKSYVEYDSEGSPEYDYATEIEISAYNVLDEMVKNSEFNNSQFNFFA